MRETNKYKYYHDADFSRILNLVSENQLERSIVEFEKYLQRYPKDYCAYAYYSDAFIKMGQFDEATRILDEFDTFSKTNLLTEQDFILMKIKLLCCSQKYEEAYNLFMQNIGMFIERKWMYKATLLFLKKKLGILGPNDYQQAAEKYLWSQIVFYDEEMAISHIGKHMSYDGNTNVVQFEPHFPLETIYTQLRKMLPLSKKIYQDTIDNLYIFKYDRNGRVNEKLVDYFEVVTLNESNDIITMYPCENKARISYADFTPSIEETPKVKKMSQIDKFAHLKR